MQSQRVLACYRFPPPSRLAACKTLGMPSKHAASIGPTSGAPAERWHGTSAGVGTLGLRSLRRRKPPSRRCVGPLKLPPCLGLASGAAEPRPRRSSRPNVEALTGEGPGAAWASRRGGAGGEREYGPRRARLNAKRKTRRRARRRRAPSRRRGARLGFGSALARRDDHQLRIKPGLGRGYALSVARHYSRAWHPLPLHRGAT